MRVALSCLVLEVSSPSSDGQIALRLQTHSRCFTAFSHLQLYLERDVCELCRNSCQFQGEPLGRACVCARARECERACASRAKIVLDCGAQKRDLAGWSPSDTGSGLGCGLKIRQIDRSSPSRGKADVRNLSALYL